MLLSPAFRTTHLVQLLMAKMKSWWSWLTNDLLCQVWLSNFSALVVMLYLAQQLQCTLVLLLLSMPLLHLTRTRLNSDPALPLEKNSELIKQNGTPSWGRL